MSVSADRLRRHIGDEVAGSSRVRAQRRHRRNRRRHRIVDLHLDRIAGRTVAGRIRHHRAEHIVAVRQVAQVRRGGRKRPAVERDLVGHRRAGRRLLARQRQIEGCILGDEVARGRARIGQVGKAQRSGRRSVSIFTSIALLVELLPVASSPPREHSRLFRQVAQVGEAGGNVPPLSETW